MLGVEAHVWIGMFDAGKGNMDRKPLPKAFPGPTAPLASPPKLAQPQTQHVFPEHSRSLLVARYGVVSEIPPHHRLDPLQGIRGGLVHAPLQLRLDFLQLGCHALADGLSQDHEVTRLVARPTNVGETQKIEGLRFSVNRASRVCPYSSYVTP